MKFSLRNIVSLVFFVPVCLSAQTKIYSPYLLPSYQESVASSKRGLPLKELFNYNCQTQRMEFKSGEDIMELADINNVDTLYLGTHKVHVSWMWCINPLASVFWLTINCVG